MGRAFTVEDASTVLQQLGNIVQRFEAAMPPEGSGSPLFPSDLPIAALQTIYEGRRLRADIFGADADMFGEPAWDILLDAAIMEAKGKAVSVTSACLAADAPPTTGLRYVKLLEDRGFLARDSDVLDNRRRFLRLTSKGRKVLNEYVRRMLDHANRTVADRVAGTNSSI